MMSSIPTQIETGNPVIVTRGLFKSYRSNRALAGLDLTVPESAVYLLVGPNGSGKTTTMKILLDLVRADSGEAQVFGLSPVTDGAMVRAYIGYVPEGGTPGYEWMKVGELLRHHGTYYPTWDVDYVRSLVDELEIDTGARYRKLSKGEARRVQIVMALAHRPPLLLLDEPMDGLDPFIRDHVIEMLISHITESPTTVLASTHHIQELEKLADHMGILYEGHFLAQISREDIHNSLRRYQLEVPEDWSGVPDLDESVINQNGSDRVLSWDIWGDESTISGKLKDSGATVREVNALRLEDAAVAVLSGKED